MKVVQTLPERSDTRLADVRAGTLVASYGGNWAIVGRGRCRDGGTLMCFCYDVETGVRHRWPENSIVHVYADAKIVPGERTS